MTTNTTTPPTAAKGREGRKKTIFSLIGITLLLSFLAVGFVHGAVNDNAQFSEDKKHPRPMDPYHIVECSSDTRYLDEVHVDGWIPVSTTNDPKDLQTCVARYGPSATRSINFHNDFLMG